MKFILLIAMNLCCILSLSAERCSSKIYDCFLFFNELEILEIKLNELYNHVDYFVLVESTETFRGNPKPLYFAENKERFSKFLDKIIQVVITEHIVTDNPWDREIYQRNQILRGLASCNDEDIIIIEDLDEIIRASKLPEITAALLTNQLRYVPCTQTLYTYFLNRYGQYGGTAVYWAGSVAAKYTDVKLRSPEGIRSERSIEYGIPDAGWHFTYMGGADRVIKKLESFSHHEHDNEAYKHPERIRKDVEDLKLVEIDETYPQFVRDNIAYFKELGFIDLGSMLANENLPDPYNKLTRILPFNIPWKAGLPWEKDENFEHAPFLEDLVHQTKAKVVIELGSYLGGSTVYIAQCLPENGKLYAVDYWKEDLPVGNEENAYVPFLSNMIHAKVAKKVIPVRMSTQEAVEFFIRNEIKPDLIYVDASYDEVSVYQDIQAYFPLIKGHGIICGDDWNLPDRNVEKAARRFAGENNLKIWVSPTSRRLWVLHEQ